MNISPISNTNLFVSNNLPAQNTCSAINTYANNFIRQNNFLSHNIAFTANIKNYGLPTKNYDLKNKTILITGGTGTLGQALVKELLENYEPKKIIVFSRDEYKQYKMKQKFKQNNQISYVIGNVRDKTAISNAAQKADVIIHTAAMKHVQICEENPEEAMKTNVQGGLNVISAALNSNVKRIISISTDKAATPENIYGESKLISERLFLNANKFAKDNQLFCNIRMGNILGSRGSVLPLFKEQIKDGELTVTNPQMTRFFITPKQAAKQILSSIEIMQGGEIFIPKLKSTDIMSLASITAPDCKIKIIGATKGEKLHEELITEKEQKRTKELIDRYVILPHLSPLEPAIEKDFANSSNSPITRFSQEELQEIINECLDD